jgi:hypothetical protein
LPLGRTSYRYRSSMVTGDTWTDGLTERLRSLARAHTDRLQTDIIPTILQIASLASYRYLNLY